MKGLVYYLSLVLILSLGFNILTATGEIEMIEQGKNVKFDFTLSVDGKEIENTQKRGPAEYTHGQKQIIPGLERQLQGLKVGDKKTIFVPAEEGFGRVNPEAFKEVPKSTLPKDLDPKIGQVLDVKDSSGNSFPAVVSEVQDEKIILDFNHPLAGKDLQFEVTIVEIK